MPANEIGLDYGPRHEPLTRREQFAMAAMQGLLAYDQNPAEPVAIWAVEHADALIAELDKKQAAAKSIEILEPGAPYPPPIKETNGCICTPEHDPNFYCRIHGR